jgi:hypothetical protein
MIKNSSAKLQSINALKTELGKQIMKKNNLVLQIAGLNEQLKSLYKFFAYYNVYYINLNVSI